MLLNISQIYKYICIIKNFVIHLFNNQIKNYGILDFILLMIAEKLTEENEDITNQFEESKK